MAYTPTEWETGDVITAEKLNKAENGIAGATPLIIPVAYDDSTYIYTLDASYSELLAHKDGFNMCKLETATKIEYGYLAQLYVSDGTYYAKFITLGAEGATTTYPFTASSEDADMTFED